jgi:hypothetical protein
MPDAYGSTLPIVGEIGLAKCKCLSHVEMSWEFENCTLCMLQEEFNGHGNIMVPKLFKTQKVGKRRELKQY